MGSGREGPHCVSRAHARGCAQIWASGISLHKGDNCPCPSEPRAKPEINTGHCHSALSVFRNPPPVYFGFCFSL